jgi:hypothetical protein
MDPIGDEFAVKALLDPPPAELLVEGLMRRFGRPCAIRLPGIEPLPAIGGGRPVAPLDLGIELQIGADRGQLALQSVGRKTELQSRRAGLQLGMLECIVEELDLAAVLPDLLRDAGRERVAEVMHRIVELDRVGNEAPDSGIAAGRGDEPAHLLEELALAGQDRSIPALVGGKSKDRADAGAGCMDDTRRCSATVLSAAPGPVG